MDGKDVLGVALRTLGHCSDTKVEDGRVVSQNSIFLFKEHHDLEVLSNMQESLSEFFNDCGMSNYDISLESEPVYGENILKYSFPVENFPKVSWRYFGPGEDKINSDLENTGREDIANKARAVSEQWISQTAKRMAAKYSSLSIP